MRSGSAWDDGDHRQALVSWKNIFSPERSARSQGRQKYPLEICLKAGTFRKNYETTNGS